MSDIKKLLMPMNGDSQEYKDKFTELAKGVKII